MAPAEGGDGLLGTPLYPLGRGQDPYPTAAAGGGEDAGLTPKAWFPWPGRSVWPAAFGTDRAQASRSPGSAGKSSSEGAKRQSVAGSCPKIAPVFACPPDLPG